MPMRSPGAEAAGPQP